MFKVKADHTLKRLVVVQGWGQITGVNCGCTNAPVCRIQSIRMALVIAAQKDWEVLQLDVQTAFFITSSQKEVHVKTLLATVNRCY